jgi:SAM-dependent methyltransferase
VVEIPWVAQRIPEVAPRVLDTGTAYAPLVHHRLLYRLPAEVTGADLTPFDLPGVRSTVADLRELPFEDGWFDATLCISTLEHIGMDNRVYSADDSSDEQGDLTALRELGRVTKSGGRVLITVPGGRDESFGWHRQYSAETFGSLVERAGLQPVEVDHFAYDNGWRAVGAEELTNYSYGQGAVAAAGLICAWLTR